MSEFGPPALFAVLVWWFTTGAILFLDGLPRRTFKWSLLGASVSLIVALYVAQLSRDDTSVGGAYQAFGAAIAIWGWLEMTFLMGFITGPRKQACSEHCSGWNRFVHASQAVIYNELATLLAAAVLIAMTFRSSNRVALGTFLILWAMRLSAKLNLFLGVPNLGEKFLPQHLRYLAGFFRRRAMNALFPLSVTLSTLATIGLARNYLAADTPFATVGYALLTSLLALAVLEHWFMVIPLPSERLWQWALRSGARSR